MRNTLIPAVLFAAALGFGGAAFAANGSAVTESSTTIAVLHGQDGTFLAEDGQLYVAPATANLRSFNEGQHVALTWYQSGDIRILTSMVPSS